MLFKRLSLSIVVALSFMIEARSAVISNAIKPVPYFSGRVRELKQIDKLFNSGEVIVSIVGISGIGKTELTRKYVFEKQKTYEVIWFFDTNLDLRSQFQLLARELNRVYGKNKLLIAEDLDLCIESTMLYIKSRNNWLFIFENLGIDENSKVIEFINQSYNGRIIVTSQDKSYLKNIINVGFLDYRISEGLIRKIYSNMTDDQTHQIYTSSHGYPLLMAQYSYLLRDSYDTASLFLETGLNQSLINVINKIVKNLSPNDFKFLIKIAMIDNHFLEKAFLLRLSKDDKTLFNLNKLNLIAQKQIENNKNTVIFEMHNLIKEKLLAITSTELVKENVIELIDEVSKLMPTSDHLYGEVLEKYPGLLSNLEYLLSYAEKYNVEIYKILELRKILLIANFCALNYKKAQEMLTWFEIEKEALIKNSTTNVQKDTIAIFLANSGAYKNFIDDDPGKAAKDFEEAIKVMQAKTSHYTKCYVYDQYAQTLACSGNVDKAFEMIEAARVEASKAESEVDEGSLHFTISKVYLEKGEYEAALKYIKQGQEIDKKLGHSQHTEPAYEVEAEILLRKGDYDKAYDVSKVMYQRSDAYFEGDHDLKARASIFLSWAAAGLNKLEEATQNIEKAKSFFVAAKSSDAERKGGEFLAYISIVEGEIALQKKEYQKALDFYIEASNNLKKIYRNNLKNDFYGYILERIVMSAKLANRQVHMRHYMLEHQEIFGKFSSRSRRIDALF